MTHRIKPCHCRRPARLAAAFRAALATLTALAALAISTAAVAQVGQHPIRLLVGFPPGGTIDLVARILAEELKEELGATVIVDSRTGAGGQLAAQALVQAPPDGRTLLLTPDHTVVMLPLTVKTPGFRPLVDLLPVGQVARYPGALAVSGNVKAKSVDEFVGWARAHPADANVGIPAPGSIPQFIAHLLGQQSKAAFVTVPYRGSAPMLQELIGGQLTAGITASGDFVEAHNAGKLRVVGVIGPRRSASLPDVPTFAEQGYRIDWEYWLGVFAPPKTPPAEIRKINDALGRVLARPQVRQRLQKIDFEPAPGTPEELTRLVRTGIDYWEPVVKSAGWVTQ